MTGRVQAVINKLEAAPKQGVSYDALGAHGWRNPIRMDTGPLLYALACAENPKLILEVGTAYGLSGCYLASALRTQGARMDTIEFDQDVADIAQANFDEAGLPVKVHVGDALEVIRGGIAGTVYDLVFLDAEKKNYHRYLQLLLDLKMVRKGTLVIADNTIDRAAECDQFIQMVIRTIPERLEIKTECGLYLARL